MSHPVYAMENVQAVKFQTMRIKIQTKIMVGGIAMTPKKKLAPTSCHSSQEVNTISII